MSDNRPKPVATDPETGKPFECDKGPCPMEPVMPGLDHWRCTRCGRRMEYR